ncbi:E3 ubiquitin-protein ligase TRIM11-like isoform X5 [Corvus hawaiiensis]|uniref:E3 ubiquitin-protein ligase TRIM11-like isoform X5 n=1 Tax=Corvus hawaiiensis TaxID=134902 RepID=UPI002018AD0E|nr:E3 ubiquitin-protein ligase TRIM11-like isoform X5 [Corvus hawaiiensis]
MAEPSLAEQLRAEASCPVCLELFQDPVSVPCGHNFCRGCIERFWESSRGSFCCPRCRNVAPERGLRPSRELGHVADIARGLLPGVPGTLCRRHREPLQLFCREERALLCLVCSRSRAHWLHRVVPAEEAAQEYKEQIQSCLQALKEEREKYLESQKSSGRRSLHLDIRQLLDSCERMKFHPPAEISSDLERSLEDFVQRNILVRGTLRRCQGGPSHGMKVLSDPESVTSLFSDSLMFQLQEPADVTLDPSTAHPNLQLSEDGKEVRGQLVPRDVPDHPERFDFEPCVLARGGFASGRHFWEVEVGQGGVWALGVVRESARRRGPLSLTPKEGVWALEAFHSLTSPRANLRLHPPPRRLRVSLDYEGRRVAFFSAGDDIPILEYTRAAFNGERVLPWFKMGMGARLLEVTRSPRCEDRGVAGRFMSPLDWVGFGFSLRICP